MRELSLEELDQVAGGLLYQCDQREFFVSIVGGATAGAVLTMLKSVGVMIPIAAFVAAFASSIMGCLTGEAAGALYDAIKDHIKIPNGIIGPCGAFMLS